MEVDTQHRRPRSDALEDKESEAYVAIFTALLKAERDAVMGEEALGANVEWFRHVIANNFWCMGECLQRFVRRDCCTLGGDGWGSWHA